MIISEQWLRDWINLDLDAQGIADCLTNAGLEVDAVESLGGAIENLVVGEVTEVAKHPDADRLNLTKVSVGDGELLDIVCGATNVRPDMLVAVATVGAKLPNGLKIKAAKVRGEVSNGMLCSAAELGLEDSSDGILELGEDAEVGQRVDEYLGLDDTLIDIDLTPNRGDCLSVQGIARELRVLADANYHPLDVNPIETTSDKVIEIQVDEPNLCPSYIGRVISGIDVQASSPMWMQERLRRSGVRPISAVVDVTNYVMLELGQPMHAFDLARLDKGIVVRKAKQGEEITLLDDSTAKLDEQTLVIADHSGPVAIAGVMGGSESAIDNSSTKIVLEAAHFTRQSASGCARRYGLHTESSHRFERGVDPLLPPTAIERATELVLAICGGEAGPVNARTFDAGLNPKAGVMIRPGRLESMLGMPLKDAEVGSILTRVSESVEKSDGGWVVSPPSYRFDIECEADLVEEVARVKGYANIPTAMPRIAPKSIAASEGKLGLRRLKHSMVARDYQEVISYSFVDPEYLAKLSDETPIRLANPLAENMSVMRTSLLPGLLQSLQFNSNRQHERIRLFEAGATYHHSNSSDSYPYKEVQRMAAVISGPRNPLQWSSDRGQVSDFYDIKGDLLAVLSLTGQKKPIIFNEFEHIALHPGQVSSLFCDGIELGWIGRLHPQLEKQLGVQMPVYAFELNLERASLAQLPEFNSVPKFPSVKRDLSMLITEAVSAQEILGEVESAVGKSLVGIELFDIYRGKGIPDGMKSVSLSLTLQNIEKTLVEEDVELFVSKAQIALEEKFAATLRS